MPSIRSSLASLAVCMMFLAGCPQDEGGAGGEAVTGAEPGAGKTACDVFTLEAAQAVLGAAAKKLEPPIKTDASSGTLSVTQCLYENGVDDPRAAMSANVLVRSAKNDVGRTSNLQGFDGNRAAAATDGRGPFEELPGLGDKAYVDPSIGQVNVLADGGRYWLIVQAGMQQKDLSEKLARAIVPNL